MIAVYLDVDSVSRGNKLAQFCAALLKGGSRDISHKDIGALFGEEDACLKTNATIFY